MPRTSCLACVLLSTALAAPSPAREPDGPWRKTLADGSVVELVGVSTSPSGPDTWWAPDGTPLGKAPYDEPFDEKPPEKGRFAREFAVRLTTPDETARLNLFVDDDLRSSNRNSRSSQDGRLTTLVSPAWAVFADGATTCSARASGGYGPWKTEGTSPPNTMVSRSTSRGGQVMFAGSWELANGNTLSVVSSRVTDDREQHIVAIDRAGDLHTCAIGTGSGDEDLYQHAYEFKLRQAEIKEFQFQTRPEYRVRFADIALHPKRPAR